MIRVAIAHDYLSARGGAERVVVSMARAFPNASVYTSFYLPELYPELVSTAVITSSWNRVRPLAKHYRAGLPVLPWIFNHLEVLEADVVLCSSSGWAHGVNTEVPKIVYCYNPARWLYQRDDHASTRGIYGAASAVLTPWLRRWDQRAAAGCARYITSSRAVATRIEQVYRRDAEVVPPPSSFDPEGPQEPIEGAREGFVLAVSRLLGYKNVAAVVEAFRELPHLSLLMIGDGPLRTDLERSAPANVTIVGGASEARLRWAYAHCTGLVSAANEDFGLTPVEAARFGKPSALLRAGGFLDTCIEGVNGVFFGTPEPKDIASALRELGDTSWDEGAIRQSAERFSEETFAARLTAIVAEVSSPRR